MKPTLRAGVMALALAGLLATLALPVSGQTFQGRVVGTDGGPIATALVRLEDPEGDQVVFTLSDTAGAYALEAPEPGEYRVVAEVYGYDPFRSPLLSVADSAGTYPVDIELRAAPIPIEGLTVSADRLESIERGLRLEIGLNPRALRVTPIFRRAIDEHLAQGHDLADIVRWTDAPSLIVKRTTEGPCFQYRNRHCLPVYLNGQRLNPEIHEVVPVDLAETIVILLPNETIMYPGGGVLLFSAAWIVR